ncbi:MAG: MiaB/RimO family radical SAM methylthiotransferase, partial [Mailhella sp.]|nr:MiaB/RimO family radical SAM methylthiotransferase [Mailhella sp.]
MVQNFTFYLRTYGCRVNQYESQAIREWWISLGGVETDDARLADVILVSSCAVTAQAVSDARQAVRQLSKIGCPRLITAGCASTAEPGDFAIPGVFAVIPQAEKFVLLQGHPLQMDNFSVGRNDYRYPPFSIKGFRRTRPVVKVQDGCSQGCAYCIVPLTRGPARSRPVQDIIAEVRRLFAAGYREIMLSGINLRQYHADSGQGRNFWSLLRCLDAEFAPEWQGRARFRLSSLDPAQITTQEGLETLGGCCMLCPHVHLSLQSGSMSVLKRMGRSPYSPQEIAEAVSQLQKAWPIMGLGADILMGFPGENDAEVEETLELIAALPMTYAHVFPYSIRPGTAAAALPGQLSKAEKHEHARLARLLVEEKKRAFLQKLLSVNSMRIAFDGESAFHGVNEWYADCRMEDGETFCSSAHELVT